MSSISEKVYSALRHPGTTILSGLYLTGVGLTAIKYLNNNREKQKHTSEKIIVVGFLTGLAATSTLFFTGKLALKND